ncbi:MAG TPA: 2-oxoacid:acceptor oxidoreductase subunit alpha, partial [Acidimicrobiales bacterium]|nr:2-oxoacid:acceptor oxidoreductase subunit alpha [Acidimicrobiales bacterium]
VCKEAGVKPRDAERSKNFFALGLVSWLYTRPIEPTIEWIGKRFAERPQVAEANTRAFRAGFDFGETAELFSSNYEVRAATFEKGEYIQVTGNQALAWGLIAAARLANLPLFLGSYPITPASDILHELSRRKEYGVRTFQAEDEIAGVGAALGAAFGGALGVTTTSGPGLDLKSEAIGLAINLELPLLVVDVQRGGPSTGLPTKTEQADLLHAMYGRHGEAPLPIIAAKTPSHCFEAAIDAARIAVKYRTPVILLSDGYLANGAEPWKLPDTDALEPIDPGFATEPNHVDDDGTAVFWPYVRDETTLARPWAPPGIPGLEHRIGGLEKADGSGNVSYDGVNHERMIHLRADKVAGVVQDIPPLDVDDDGADVLVLGWGSTYGAISAGVRRVRARGQKVAQAHLVHLNPFPANFGDVLGRYRRVLVPEINLGQLSRLIRAEFLVDVQSLNKMQGVPFRAAEIETAILTLLGGI